MHTNIQTEAIIRNQVCAGLSSLGLKAHPKESSFVYIYIYIYIYIYTY